MLSVIVTQATPRPSSFQEIADGIIVILLCGISTFIFRKFKTLDKVVDVMGTRAPSDLEPHPPKGLVDQVLDVTVATGENTNAVLAMSVRQSQANGTMKIMSKDIGDIRSAVTEIAGKPPASVAEVKEAVAHEHEAGEARQAELLGAIQKDTTALVKDMHTGGGSSSRDLLESVVQEQERLKDDEEA